MSRGASPRVSQLQVDELKQRLDRGEPLVLLDVREDDERAFCAIPGDGLHVPLREIPGRLEEVRTAAATAPMVVYCHHGVRSMTAATWLAQQGLEPLYNLQGGIDAWSARVDPTVRRY